MELIQCKNQTQIIQALIVRDNYSDKAITHKDENAIFFLIKEQGEINGMFSITCSDDNIIIEDFYALNDALKIEALNKLEEFSKKMNFKFFTCHCEIESSYFYRDAGFSNFEDLHVENEKLYVRMVKKL